MRLVASLALAVLVACGGDDSPDPVDCARSPDGAACADGGACSAGACLRTITGAWTSARSLEAGEVAAPPPDLRGVPLGAIVETATGFVEYAGVGHADGSFEIADVPVGRYWLVYPDPPASPLDLVFDERSESVVALSTTALGRERSAASPATAVVWELTGLEPWAPGETEVTVRCVNAWSTEYLDAPAPAPGATSATFVGDARVLYDGGQGDRVSVVQLGPVESAGRRHLAAVAAASLPDAFAIQDGASQTVLVALAPLARVRRTFDWRLARFDEVAAREYVPAPDPGLGPPPAVVGAHVLHLQADPWPPSSLAYAHAALVSASLGEGDVRLDGLEYGLAWPASFGEVWRHETWKELTLRLPGTATARRVRVSTRAMGIVSGSGVTVVEAALTPPRDVRLTPAPGATGGSVGRSPTLSWSPPALGTPEAYWVTVPRPGDVPARLRTRRTEIVLPPGVLQEGALQHAFVAASERRGAAEAVVGLFVP